MELPQPRYARRILLALFIATSVLLLIVLFVVIPLLFRTPLPSAHSVLTAILLSLFTSVVTTGVAAIALDWLLPRPSHLDRIVSVVDPRERDEAIERARRGTERWWFTGGLGRYNRAVVLPELARRARSQNSSISVVLLLIDPDSSAVCNRYARLRMGLRSGKATDWSLRRVRIELLATIVTAYCWVHSEPLLSIEIGLKDSCSLMRTEISAHTVIMTTEEPHALALSFSKGSAFYDIYVEEFRLAMSQSKMLPPSNATFPVQEVSSERVVELLKDLGLRADVLQTDELADICAAVQMPQHQYR